MASIETQLRNAARNSGLSIKRLAVTAGVPYAAVHGFVHGKGITLATAAKLAAVLGFELRKVRVQHGQKA